jgi:tetratricopeptide (TPR) repeat protein
MTRLTLCMIARNEEAMLPACLESVRGVVDEVVFVDTGSTDRTIEIARFFGAKVYEEPWADDFAHPRNTALRHATGDWVLQLDADERLSSRAGHELKRALHKKPSFDCALVALHNADALGADPDEVFSGARRLGVPAWLPRVLRRTPTLRYEGIIHESVLESLAERGLKVAKLEGVDILHLGAVPEFRARKGKSNRNLTLLMKRCELEPTSVLPFGYVALELVQAGRAAEALPYLERGWPLIAQQPRYRSALRLAVARGLVQLARDDGAGLLETARVVEGHEGAHPDLEFLKACGHELQGFHAPSAAAARASFQQAAHGYRRCVEHHWAHTADVFIQGGTSWSGWARLGTMQLILDDFAGAQKAFTHALKTAPQLIDAQLGLVEAQLMAGNANKALTAVEPLLKDTPDAWALAAGAALMLCAPGDARLFYSRALERGGAGKLLSRHRAALLESLELALPSPPPAILLASGASAAAVLLAPDQGVAPLTRVEKPKPLLLAAR